MALARALVLERDHAFRVGLVLDQRKVALREAAGEERDAFTEQNRNDAQVEFIDQVCFEEFHDVECILTPRQEPDCSSVALFRALQLRADSPQLADHSGDGSECNRPRLNNRGIAECGCFRLEFAREPTR